MTEEWLQCIYYSRWLKYINWWKTPTDNWSSSKGSLVFNIYVLHLPRGARGREYRQGRVFVHHCSPFNANTEEWESPLLSSYVLPEPTYVMIVKTLERYREETHKTIALFLPFLNPFAISNVLNFFYKSQDSIHFRLCRSKIVLLSLTSQTNII